MSEEIERVLKTLFDQSSPSGRGGVTVSYLSTRLGIEHSRLLKTVGMLERAGLVHVGQVGRVKLVALTSLGRNKVAALYQTKPQSRVRQVSTLTKAVGACLLVMLVGFLWWWLDLFPQTNGVPRAASAPFPSATLRSTESAVILPTGTAISTPTDVPPMASETATPTAVAPSPTATAVDTPDPSTLTPQTTAIPTPVMLVEQPADAVNIVLMGADTSGSSWRTDTLIVVSVDPRLPSVSMLSIPRDLYVYIPGWKMERINTADFHGERVGYPGGGPGLVKATIEYNLGVRVDYFARVDFQGFVKILDTLGGIDVVVDCELHDTFPDPEAVEGSSDIDLLPGVHHLNAKQTLWYARSRWNTSDFDRGRRQQRVLRGILAQIKQLDLLPKLPELWDELTQTAQTDLSLETALWLAKVAGRLDTERALKSRFIDNTVVQSWRTPEGAAVLLPAFERIGPLIAEALAPPDTARSRQGLARVEVLNGTAWPDWAILAADRLMWEGFEVVDIGQAERTDHQQTTIVDLTETTKGSAVDYLAAVLKVGAANVTPADAPSDEVDFRVVVGYDFRPCYNNYWRAVHAPTPTPTPTP